MLSKTHTSQTVESLKTKLSGTVVADHDKEYVEQRKAWLDVVEQRPSPIVNAATVEDIVEAVRTHETWDCLSESRILVMDWLSPATKVCF